MANEPVSTDKAIATITVRFISVSSRAFLVFAHGRQFRGGRMRGS